MSSINDFWKPRLSGATAPKRSGIAGWSDQPQGTAGFVEPTLSPVSGDASSAKIFVISAPGAVGKSTFARQLAAAVNFALVDLAHTTPLGGNFFKGGLANAFGFDALPAAANGSLGLVVDGLDEAQLRAAPSAFEAALLDLAEIASLPDALPSILLGRALAAEEAVFYLEAAGHAVCSFNIEFFDDTQAAAYIERKSVSIASAKPAIGKTFEQHRDAFIGLANETRERLKAVSSEDERRFAGYAPVLDAVCEFALDDDQRNPQARLSNLSGSTSVELVQSVSRSVLAREQRKLCAQLSAKFPSLAEAGTLGLYSIEEQRERITAKLLGLPAPDMPLIEDRAARETYADMVSQFIAQHPFLDGSGKSPANVVFAADMYVWALTNSPVSEAARKRLSSEPRLLSGILFDLYADWLSRSSDHVLLLSHVGLLFQALQSRTNATQRGVLEVSSDDEEEAGGPKGVSVSFEVTGRTTTETQAKYGPYRSNDESALELRAPFSHVYVDADIWVELGDGASQQIGAPTEISARELTISARQVFIHGTAPVGAEQQVVSLSAVEVDAQHVSSLTVNGCSFQVTWPGARLFPWTDYAHEPQAARTPEIDFMRRRLGKIITSFRSHSKGELVRYAPKIDSIRMTKDARGQNLVRALIEDGILETFDAGQFYRLDPDRLGSQLNTDYLSLHQKRFSAETDQYLERVLTRY